MTGGHNKITVILWTIYNNSSWGDNIHMLTSLILFLYY